MRRAASLGARRLLRALQAPGGAGCGLGAPLPLPAAACATLMAVQQTASCRTLAWRAGSLEGVFSPAARTFATATASGDSGPLKQFRQVQSVDRPACHRRHLPPPPLAPGGAPPPAPLLPLGLSRSIRPCQLLHTVTLPSLPPAACRLAQTGEGIKECELVQWFVAAGDAVEEFGRVCEVQSDKATIEITSPYAGAASRRSCSRLWLPGGACFGS